MARLVECVPNFSEGRDPAAIREITNEIEAVAGVRLLDVDPGAETNRVVVTFVGEPEAVGEAAFRAIRRAAQVIDMAVQQGSHPRMGATDVCPFVPVDGVSMDDCVALARALGERVGRELGIPVYLYEAAASKPERRNLAAIRKGEYEGLAQKLADPNWAPDFGPAAFHARAGATVIGAREFLIAWNIDLNTRDKSLATDIAYELRERGRSARRPNATAFYNKGEILKHRDGSHPCGTCGEMFASLDDMCRHTFENHGYDYRELVRLHDLDPDRLDGESVKRPGLFRGVKAIGWTVPEYDRAQISINLTNFRAAPLHEVMEATRRLAAERGLVVTGSEIVGLVPKAALLEAGRFYLARQGRTRGIPERDLLETAVQSLGLRDVAAFELSAKVLGFSPPPEKALIRLRVDDLVHEVSRDSPAPGGGSVAALAGALGAALAAMVASLTVGKAGHEDGWARLDEVAISAQKVKDRLLLAVDADTDAFAAYMNAKKLPNSSEAEKAAKKRALLEGLQAAARVPLETARLGLEAMSLSKIAAEIGNKASVSDAGVGAQMAMAAVVGGVLNVRINLRGIDDAGFVAEMDSECARLKFAARSLLDDVMAVVAKRIAEL